MSTVWKLSGGSTSGALKKCQGSGSKNVIGVSQSATQTVDDYKTQFFESAKKLGLLEDEMLLAKWFRDGLREEIRREVRKTTTKDTMEKIFHLAYAVETRIGKEAAVVDKHIILCEDEKPEDEEEDEPEDDPEEVPTEEDHVENAEEDENNEGDADDDFRFWDYDDLDQWGVGTPPHQ